MAYVYCHLKADNDEPFYVGISRNNKRPYQITRRTSNHNSITEKHGVRVEIIAKDLDWNQACFWEVRWIKALRNLGYDLVNLTSGGSGTNGFSRLQSEDTRLKIRNTMISKGIVPKNAGQKASVETRKKMSAAKAGRPAHNKGKKAKPGTGFKISASLMGREVTPETRLKISLSNKGNKNTIGRVQSEKEKSLRSTLRYFWWAERKLNYWGA